MSDMEFALMHQPLLELDPNEPDRIVDVLYKVRRYRDKTCVLYVYSWDKQTSPYLGWLLDHPFDYEPVIVTINKAGQITKVVYDRGHYRVGETDRPYLKVMRGFHNFKPLREVPENAWKADKMRELTEDNVRAIDEKLKTVKTFFGVFKPLSIRGVYEDPGNYKAGDSFTFPAVDSRKLKT